MSDQDPSRFIISNTKLKAARKHVRGLGAKYKCDHLKPPRPKVVLGVDDEGQITLSISHELLVSFNATAHEGTEAVDFTQELADELVEAGMAAFIRSAVTYVYMLQNTCPLDGGFVEQSRVGNLDGSSRLVCSTCGWTPSLPVIQPAANNGKVVPS